MRVIIADFAERMKPQAICQKETDGNWRRDRVAEGAPLLREYVPKAHQGFESLRLRQDISLSD